MEITLICILFSINIYDMIYFNESDILVRQSVLYISWKLSFTEDYNESTGGYNE